MKRLVMEKETEEAVVDHIVAFGGTGEKRLALVCREIDGGQGKEGGQFRIMQRDGEEGETAGRSAWEREEKWEVRSQCPV